MIFNKKYAILDKVDMVRVKSGLASPLFYDYTERKTFREHKTFYVLLKEEYHGGSERI